ncbi:uncharacterized protein I303_104279 [Kwoniella dejecticola CBS 10117]|uniref:Solute carrier family 26 (Sodium-independent sulfate anion transporter), member 11 n=1 Tax=Kwoniella dejecticola CBS 10117 TaxID=1296121 RepID=A0A1A6A5S8_9TREE|nr:solute carrier family 26 (sodium-independent sulfate anion transporter), member 11 [Kwoniella dejecticola CBS 10117]OBR85409.1 solute carrier family 26 (sodium-independent sulfate anion transporter), member 11 [Kwoniella dejecticola CBS 10117]
MATYESRDIKTRVKNYFGYTDSTPETISVTSWAKSTTPDAGQAVKTYLLSLFPFIQWVPRYNLTWLLGDLIAGITVGMVLVPQSLSYAKIALLPAQYGLYSSFIGVLTYAFFATSKDVSIGPVAVMSLETGNIIAAVQDKYGDLYSAPVIATALAFICGFVVLAIGLLRLGWLVEFIPQPAVSGFMTGSALNIAAGQFPAVFGLAKRFNTRDATYKVIINTLKNLPHSSLDAAFGVTALAMLYFLKWGFAYLGQKKPRLARIAFFASCFRHAFVIILYTIISWRVNIHHKTPRIALVGSVPSGLRDVGRPHITGELIGAIGPHIPVATIILLLEHISIAKSFGRLNGYKINPNQELVAIGVNNTLGTLFSAYPSTGSFSRSALKSKAGVRTPAAGLATGVVVIVALYAVAPAFYWIPNAALSALIIHAVADLVASPKHSYGFWRVSPLEYIIFVGAVLWSVFYTIESGIYWSLATSIVLLLVRLARPKGHFLGRVRIKPESPEGGHQIRDVYLPLCSEAHQDIPVESPPPGVVIYRFEESFLYPNASLINDRIVHYVKANTRRGKDFSGISAGDRPWNDPGPKKNESAAAIEEQQSKPKLRAVILDFTAVANLDTTGVQNLIDTRVEVEKWADAPVEFHFCGILSPWIRRALIAGGFGQGNTRAGTALEVAPAVITNLENVASPHPQPERDSDGFPINRTLDLETGEQLLGEGQNQGASGSGSGTSSSRGSFVDEKAIHGVGLNKDGTFKRRTSDNSHRTVPLVDKSTPFFHFDLPDAINSLNLEEQ